MTVLHKTLSFTTQGNKATYFEIREECREFVQQSNVQNGILVIQSPHTTCGVFFEEFVHDIDALGDEFLQRDLNKGLNKIFPKQLTYDDEYAYPGPMHLSFGRERPNSPLKENPAILLNGDAHCKATIIGSDCTLIIKDGQLQTGSFGYIYFVDFDGNRARSRNCHLCILGL